jgi:hypothetical protein
MFIASVALTQMKINVCFNDGEAQVWYELPPRTLW